MKQEPVMFAAAPRLLLGVSFLFWGAMHDRPLPALAAAILLEGRHWTNLRWQFKEKGFAKSWQLSVLILIISALALLQVENRVASDFLNLLSWLPFMMLPLALAQQYSSDRGVPVTTFSFIARRKIAADRKAGRLVRIRDINLSYPYFILILIVAGMGVGNILRFGFNEIHYALGVIVLLAWGLFAMGKKKERRGAWGIAYLMSLGMALGMTLGVISAYRYFEKSLTRPSKEVGSEFETQTSIGQVRKLQLSPTIMWRYYHKSGKAPELVKISSYNWPEGDIWRARGRRRAQKERISEDREVGGDFEKFLTVGEDAYVFHEKDRGVEQFSTEGEIIGMVSDQSLVPHPLRTKRLEEVPTEILSANSMGAIQLNGPGQGAMKIKLYADEDSQAVEHDPSMMDLLCPSREQKGLDQFIEKLGFRPTAWKAKPGKGRHRLTGTSEVAPDQISPSDFREFGRELKKVFLTDFTYSLFAKKVDMRAPISEFVNVKKEGHCEYFASATTLLLRRMGVPSRYVVGFAVREEGSEPREFYLRGKHAHSWAQAYVGGSWVDEARPGSSTPLWRCRGGKWVDVDLTPADWLSEGAGNSWYQGLSDWFQKSKANLVLWFSKSTVSLVFKIVLLFVGGTFLIYLIYKMIKTRGREGRGLPGSWEEELRKQGYLRDFEAWLARRVGPRPASMPMASWLRNHLPEEGGRLIECYERASFHPDHLGAAKIGEEIQTAKALWKKTQKTPGLEAAAGS